jgi:hypothetical protein
LLIVPLLMVMIREPLDAIWLWKVAAAQARALNERRAQRLQHLHAPDPTATHPPAFATPATTFAPETPRVSARDPGWRADPLRRALYRYWDGNQWTAYVDGPGSSGWDPVRIETPPVDLPIASGTTSSRPDLRSSAAKAAGPAINGLAVYAFFFGLGGACVLWIVALVLARVSLRQIRESRGGQTGETLAYLGIAFAVLWGLLETYGAAALVVERL